MKKPIQISIPTPCHENWANMSPADKGRFCASCQKNVRDFTRSSDREIADVLKKEGKLCGRFRASQLERELYVPQEKSKFWAVTSAAAITLLTVGVTEVSAQTPVQTEQHESKIDDLSKKPNGLKTITGTVTDEQGFTLPGVNVTVRGTNRVVQTDFDGVYSVEAENGQILEFAYIGMKTQTITVSEKANYKFVMREEYGELIGEIIIKNSGDTRPHISVASQFMFGY
ncbi:carboxypeptidase-like regulatory domain-containing protein [Flavobacterium sp. DGU11]|uniref:Carboxypeptidase-like regulatory domain-containing protein n=1 Tax=Flavobacterium arundinis TaxID=3139143 RepID=A0ABU9HSD8_9FLAO